MTLLIVTQTYGLSFLLTFNFAIGRYGRNRNARKECLKRLRRQIGGIAKTKVPWLTQRQHTKSIATDCVSPAMPVIQSRRRNIWTPRMCWMLGR